MGADEQIDSQRNRSPAANFNAKVFRKLPKAFAASPDANLLPIFSKESSARLSKMKEQKRARVLGSYSTLIDKVLEVDVVAAVHLPEEQDSVISRRMRELALAIGATTVVFPLSESVQDLLGAHAHDINTIRSQSLPIILTNAIESSQII